MEMDGKKKILIAITKANWGGAQKYVFDLATNLSKDQFEVTVLVGQGGTLLEKLKTCGVRMISLSELGRDIRPTSDRQAFRELKKILLTENFDILHLNSSKMGLFGALAGQLVGVKKIIFTAHGWAFNEDIGWLKKFGFKILQWLTVMLAHQTICVSESTKRQISGWPFLKNKLAVIYNGINDIKFLDLQTAREALLSRIENQSLKTELLSQSLWAGTIGELHKNKGQTFLISAWAELQNEVPDLPPLFIIGEGEERQWLEKLVREKKLTEKVFLLGQIPNASDYLKAFNLFILPSITEGLPFVVLEAGKASCAVVASRVGGLPEIITNGENGILVRKKNVGDLKQAISQILFDSQKMAYFGHNLEQKIELGFSQAKMIRETIKMYQRVV